MGKAEDTCKEINNITAKLIELGLCDDQKFAVVKTKGKDRKEVSFQEEEDISFALRNIPYQDIYSEMRRRRNYNLVLPDGGLIQLQYAFDQEQIERHRLCFFPSPDLTVYQNDPELY